MAKPTIAITGANGFIGSALSRYFSQQGWQVIALVRKPGPQVAGVSYRTYDLQTKPADAILKDADYLVHAAYIKHDAKHPDALAQNIQGTNWLLEISRRANLKRNIFLSSLSARPDAASIYGQQKYQLEQLFQSTNDSIIRPGLVLGTGGLLLETIKFIRSKHFVPLINGGEQPLQYVDIASLVTAIEVILTKNYSGVFTVASPESLSYKDFYRFLATSLDLKALFLPVPYWLLLVAVKATAILGLKLGITEDNLVGLKTSGTVTSQPDLERLEITIPDLQTIFQRLRT